MRAATIASRHCKLLAAALSVGVIAIPSAVRATTLFSDNFSNDTATFAYPDAASGHQPATPSGPGSWTYNYLNYEMIQAGVITNTLPGGGTGGANGNPNYMAIQRDAGGPGWAAANFATPANTTGTLSAQWDMYDVGPGRNFQIFLSDAAGSSAPFGNNGPLIMASYFPPASPGDMELGAYAPGYLDMGGFPDNAWVHMDMEVNLSAQTYQLFVNGNLTSISGTGQSTFTYLQPTGPLESLDFYGASAAGETIDVDNISVVESPVPEPATLSLLSLGGLVAFRRPGRRHRR